MDPGRTSCLTSTMYMTVARCVRFGSIAGHDLTKLVLLSAESLQQVGDNRAHLWKVLLEG